MWKNVTLGQFGDYLRRAYICLTMNVCYIFRYFLGFSSNVKEQDHALISFHTGKASFNLLHFIVGYTGVVFYFSVLFLYLKFYSQVKAALIALRFSCRWRRWWMSGHLLQRTSTYLVSTSTGLFWEPATKKGLRYLKKTKTKSITAQMSGEYLHYVILTVTVTKISLHKRDCRSVSLY